MALRQILRADLDVFDTPARTNLWQPDAPFPSDAPAGDLDTAVNGLRRSAPHHSNAEPLARWQRWTIALSPGVPAALWMAPGTQAASVIFLVVALAFCLVIMLRLLALSQVWSDPGAPTAERFGADGDGEVPRLPSVSVLVPLYRESAIVPALVDALAALDYPSERLETIYILEADDHETAAAFRALRLPEHMRLVTVPDGLPKTKPRALNFALLSARGDIVSVFDAEDVPDRDQLRRAATAFAAGGPRLACLQAKLGIYNSTASFTTRQFALEYAALFHGVLPALDRLGLPLPLGGTSNHFRRSALIDAGGWDPFNVTEDADLGIRFARLGYKVAVLGSQTFEEAPETWRGWLGQRTRWLKGWMQTYLVHMRAPRQLLRELGPWRFFGFQLTLGGMILSAIVHPWAYAGAFLSALSGGRLFPDDSLAWALCGFNLVAGYAAGAALAALTAHRLGTVRGLTAVLWLPVYWLAISLAAYRAIGDLVRRPHYWEKTSHRARNETGVPAVLIRGPLSGPEHGR